MIKGAVTMAHEGGVRLDAALVKAFSTTTRAFAREAIESGAVLVDGHRASKGLKLKGGERIEIKALSEACDNVVAPNAKISVECVYEDAEILAFDKPAGMPVQPLSHTETNTLMNGVVAKFPECQAIGDRPLMSGALHRIDAATSGLVLVARSERAFEQLRAQFAAQTVEKTYLALVEGKIDDGGTIEGELTHDRRLPHCKMIASSSPAFHAVTDYKPIGYTAVENENRTLLKVTIFTGVTHQIRAQLAMRGMHIVNDRLYGAFAVENQTGHCLHAYSAKFIHPITRRTIVIKTSIPAWASFTDPPCVD